MDQYETETTQGEIPAEAATPVTPEIEEQLPAESATAPEAPDSASDDDKPKGGFQRRISELTRNWREAERRNDELIQLLVGTRGNTPEAEPAPPVKPIEPPTLAQFDYDETKYQQAVADYTRTQAEAAADARIEAWQRSQAEQARLQSFKGREAEFAKSADDYADLVYDPRATFFTRDVVDAIRESEIGPQLAYHLAKNPEEGRRIASLPPLAAGRELGRIEARLTAASAAPPRVTNAPPPPPKLDTADAGVDEDPDKMPIEKWLKWREKQLRKSGR